MTSTSPPSSSIITRVRSRPSSERAVIPTLAPSAARRTARPVPLPPWLAPVTSATMPSHFPLTRSSSDRHPGAEA